MSEDSGHDSRRAPDWRGLADHEKYERLARETPGGWWDLRGFFGFLTHNQTLEAFTFMIWEQEYRQQVMPKGAHDFHKFITPEALGAALERVGLTPVGLRGLTRSGSGESYAIEVSDDLSISYLGYAMKPLKAA